MDKISLLVLDDDQFVLRVLVDLFGSEYEVRCAASVEAFRKAMNDYLPDLVLIDVMLPDGDGIDICREVRSNELAKNIFIIMLTSFDDNVLIEKAYRYGANDYIRKPFVPFEISSKVALIAKNIEYQKTVIGLYERQKDINNKLFKLASIINTNIHLTNKYGMMTSLFQITAFVDALYIEVVFSDDEDNVTSNKRSMRDSFEPVDYQKLKGKMSIFSDSRMDQQSVKIRDQKNDVLYYRDWGIYEWQSHRNL